MPCTSNLSQDSVPLTWRTVAPTLLAALLLAACSSDSSSSGGGATGIGDPADLFIYGAWTEGALGTAVPGEPVLGNWSDWTPTTGTGDTLVQTRMRTVMTTSTAPRTDTRNCTVQVNGDEDTPPLDCANAEITRIVEVVTDTSETVQTEEQTLDNAADTAEWVATEGADPVSTAVKTITARTFNDDDALAFSPDATPVITFSATATETFNQTAGMVTQNRTCTRSIQGLLDNPASSPTCANDGTDHALATSLDFFVEAIEESMDTSESVSYDWTVHNPLAYTAAQIATDEFRNASVSDPDTNGYGYDIADLDDPEQRFLITNLGRGTLFNGFFTTPTPGWWYDTDGTDGYQAETDTFIAQPAATDYTNLASHEVDVRAAHTAGWNGYDTYIYLPAVEIFTDTERAKLATVAPGATQTASNVPLARLFYVSVGSGIAIGTDSVTVFDCAAASVCGNVLVDDGRLSVHTDTEEDAHLIDDVVVVTGAAALMSHKFNGLSGRQIAHIMVATRGADRELQIAKALSPVGELQ